MAKSAVVSGCTNVTKVDVSAGGTPDSNDATAFANQASTGAATGVAVQLFGGPNQTVQLLPNGSTSAEYSVVNSAVDMPFLAKLVRTVAADSGDTTGVTAGSVSSTATLYMNYE